MAQQLFWFETILKFTAGIALLVAPVSLARLIGLPHGQVGFWARILGLTLIGLAGAIYVEGSQTSSRGLGFAGLAVINVAAIVAFFGLIMTRQVKTWRGHAILWVTIILLLLLTLFEIAFA